LASHLRDLIKMSEAEVAAFIAEQRALTMCTMHRDGSIHAVAMWYGLHEGDVAIATKAKSQKVANLLRDPRMTILIETGDRYEELRGVELVGQAEILREPAILTSFGIQMFERFTGPYDEGHRAEIDRRMSNRVIIVMRPTRVVSWDHRKLPGTASGG
jgi:PPOX class probable F420-dependent enzyme